ncbi:OLC1v1026430C1 [Oldenlandia corymbosa var. corymbosa]|uniref:OLC1v1026430C1 n=1 Tax=Oldenlandia corymbosa var. corymbosa TaxID=529605 RepID=A0AAV1C9S2_OLDCO|nr:OLC1v1026430C1 [Oldenlandia corymbosa var. corymbosa]
MDLGDVASAKKKRVVVIGGGIAGAVAAKNLQDHADVFLIDQKEYFEITWASLRARVEPAFAKRSIVNHVEYLPNAHVITTPAVDVTPNEVLTAEGRLIAYDYLVIATGHVEDGPSTKDDKLSYYQEEHSKIRSANSILIVGGGPTGVELAAEIAVDFPGKKVTLVHRGSRLLEFIGEKASRKALDWLVSKNVEVVLGQSVDLNGVVDGVYHTSAGETIKADCHFLCTGIPIASSWLRNTLFSESLDAKGRLMVDLNLRVKGHKNVFAIGDITDIPELKQGYLAEQHAFVAAKNVGLLISGGNENRMEKYKAASGVLAIVSLGRKDAVAQFYCVTIVGRVPGLIKSGDLFVGKTRKLIGLSSDI